MSYKLIRFLLFIMFFSPFGAACSPARALPLQNTPAPYPLPTVIETHGLTSMPVTATALATCTEKTGSLETGVIDTSLLAKPMSYTVYLPPCYTFEPNKRYPVLYLLHGQGSTEDQWIRIGAAATADQLITSGDIPPFIIVFPFDYSYKQPPEYSFEDVFVQMLIPKIDSNYRTLNMALYRAIGGLSRGGAWALHIGIRHPGLFGAIGGHSPAIFYSDDKSLPGSLLSIPVGLLPRIWLDAGDKDSEYGVIAPFEEFLSKNNIPHEWHVYIGWHNEEYWSAHVNQYLRWYAQNWR
jgi:enterochelin esterase-like enzyme